MTARGFWTEIKRGALRPTDPPSWIAVNLLSPVSLAVPHIPGTPDRKPRQDPKREQEAAQ
jgi:hypothetical protein